MNDMYKTYDCKKFNYYTSSTFDNRVKEYLLDRYAPEVTWDFGDTVTLKFNLSEFDLENKEIELDFYNFRMEKLNIDTKDKTYLEEDNLIYHLDYNTSNTYFPRGIYYCSIKLVQYEDKEIESAKTIISANNYSIYVK